MKTRMLSVVTALACVALSGCSLTGGSQQSDEPRRMRLGCQMWGVKEFWEKDPERGFAEVFPKLRAMGYEGVQSMAFWKIDQDRLEALLKENDLALVDMPVNFEHVEGESLKDTVAFCRRFNVDFVYIPWFEGKTADEWRSFCARLAAAGKRLAPYGIRIGYHNHIHEFAKPLQGEYPADILKSDPNVNLELDIGPVTESGNDAPTWIAALAGRVPGMHAKPHGASAAGAPGDVQNWPKVIAAARDAGVKWFVVECEKRKDTYDDVAASAAFLKPLLNAAEYSKVSCDASALPADKRFLAEMLQSRVEARTVPSDSAKTLAVRFVLDDEIKGENAVVAVKGGRAEIRAGRFRGLVFGAGLLLRTVRYGEKAFSLADGEYRFEPKKSLRMCYMARHFLNWYDLAAPDELTTYIDDLALSGHNAFKVQCELPTPGRNGNFEKASLAVVNRVHALDCGFCSGGGSNQAPEDSPEELRGVPNSDPKRGNLGFNVCISKPGGMDYLCRLREGQIAKLAGSNSDYFCYWPFDEGGCECDGCKPWGGNGFLRLIELFRAMNNTAFPSAKTIISTWVFHDDDWEGLYKWLETHDGVDYILADSHTDFPKYPLEHPAPKGIPIMTFPEISMWGRAPWGGYGATALPKRFTRLFRQVERIADGFMSYSEGLYEDINKEVVNALYINPSADTDNILRAYAAYYLPGTDPEDFVRLCGIFETNHKFPGDHSHPSFKGVAPDSKELAEYRSRAAEACRIVKRMEKGILPTMRSSWRWRLVYLRAMIDREILATCQGAPESARKYFEELVEMYHAERQLAGWRKTGTRGWTTPQFKAK